MLSRDQLIVQAVLKRTSTMVERLVVRVIDLYVRDVVVYAYVRIQVMVPCYYPPTSLSFEHEERGVFMHMSTIVSILRLLELQRHSICGIR